MSTLNVTTADLGNGQIVSKIQAEITKHPEADWIKSPYTYVTTLGVAQALGTNAGKIKVMGGEGFADELDLIRSGQDHRGQRDLVGVGRLGVRSTP